MELNGFRTKLRCVTDFQWGPKINQIGKLGEVYGFRVFFGDLSGFRWIYGYFLGIYGYTDLGPNYDA